MLYSRYSRNVLAPLGNVIHELLTKQKMPAEFYAVLFEMNKKLYQNRLDRPPDRLPTDAKIFGQTPIISSLAQPRIGMNA
jgi:hypothetical protein